VPWSFVLEVLTGAVFGAATGAQPPKSAGVWTCRALGVCGVGVSVAYAAFALWVRPLSSKIDTAIHMAIAIGQTLLSILAAMSGWGSENPETAERYAELFGRGALAMTVLFLVQTVAGAAQSFQGHFAKKTQPVQTADASASPAAPLLVAPRNEGPTPASPSESPAGPQTTNPLSPASPANDKLSKSRSPAAVALTSPHQPRRNPLHRSPQGFADDHSL